jgi:hypothetical protein
MRHVGLALGAGIVLSSSLLGDPIFTAQISITPTEFCTASPSVTNSLQPASASGTCSFFTPGGPPSDGNARAIAAANFGHVGVTAEVDATNPNGVITGGVFVSANEQGFVTFTGNNGQAGPIVVNFNIGFVGFVNAGGDSRDVAQMAFNAQLNGVPYGIQNLVFAGDGTTSCGTIGTFICTGGFAPGFFPTDPVLVPLNVPVPFGLFISANVGNFGSAPVSNSAIADFANSLDLPIGSDIFNLPAGFTANSTDFNIVDNRLLGAVSGVPEPSTFPLVCLSILVFATGRLIRQSRSSRSRCR